MAQKRWAVREHREDGWYILFVGAKPRKAKGEWNTRRPEYVGFECPKEFERFCPKRYHLPPGGGPVLIEFKEP